MTRSDGQLRDLMAAVSTDRADADAYYAAYLTVDARYVFWWKQVGIGMALVTASGLGLLKEGQALSFLDIAAQYLTPLALIYTTAAYVALTLVDQKRRFYAAYFGRLQRQQGTARRIDALLRYPAIAMASAYDPIDITDSGRSMGGAAMARRLVLIVVVIASYALVFAFWTALLYWLAFERQDGGPLWLMRLVVIVHGATLVLTRIVSAADRGGTPPAGPAPSHR